MFRVRHPVADDRTLPLSCGMFLHAKNVVFNSKLPQDTAMIGALGLVRSCLHASETVVCKDRSNLLLSDHIKFNILINGLAQCLFYMNLKKCYHVRCYRCHHHLRFS